MRNEAERNAGFGRGLHLALAADPEPFLEGAPELLGARHEGRPPAPLRTAVLAIAGPVLDLADEPDGLGLVTADPKANLYRAHVVAAEKAPELRFHGAGQGGIVASKGVGDDVDGIAPPLSILHRMESRPCGVADRMRSRDTHGSLQPSGDHLGFSKSRTTRRTTEKARSAVATA